MLSARQCTGHSIRTPIFSHLRRPVNFGLQLQETATRLLVGAGPSIVGVHSELLMGIGSTHCQQRV